MHIAPGEESARLRNRRVLMPMWCTHALIVAAPYPVVQLPSVDRLPVRGTSMIAKPTINESPSGTANQHPTSGENIPPYDLRL